MVDPATNLTNESTSKRIALVIGVNEAPNSELSLLNYASSDAEAMAEVLQQHRSFELLVPTLLNESATSAQFKKSVLKLSRQRTDEDFLLLYFSGHGKSMKIESGRHAIYLGSHDFDEIDVDDDENLHVSLHWLREKLFEGTEAGRVLVILDCCYSGDMGRTAEDHYLKDLRQRIAYYFEALGAESGARSGSLRLALTATGHNALAAARDGHGLMTGLLLQALRGEIDAVLETENQGQISIQRLHRYLEITMQEQQPSLSGDFAGRSCILTSYPDRAAQLHAKPSRPSGADRPNNYIPFPRNPLFQPRPGEFERLEHLLFSPETQQIAASQDVEAKAARFVCQSVGYLPLALVHLRGQLARDQKVTLVRLAEVLKQRGALDIAKAQQGDVAPLFATFELSWKKMQSEAARRLFKLASYLPEATPIPVWLLGLAAGLGESGDIFDPLGEALLQLQELSLVEELSGDQIRLHPLVREFGQRLAAENGGEGKSLREETGERLTSEFANLNILASRAQREGYWTCLEQVRAAYEYTKLLRTDRAEQLERIERWLGRESYVLGNEKWWPDLVPGLFYQQLYNRSVEDGHRLLVGDQPVRWLRQLDYVGAEDRSLLWVFIGHSDGVERVAFFPDGTKLLTSSLDKTVRAWETMSGKLLATFECQIDQVTSVMFSPDGTKVLTSSFSGIMQLWEMASRKLLTAFKGHTDQVTSVAFSPDGTKLLTGSLDKTARVWEMKSGKVQLTLDGHPEVESMLFSPDGSKILIRSWGGGVQLYEMKSGKVLTTINRPGITGILLSPDGSKMLISFWGGIVQLCEIMSGKVLITLNSDAYQVTCIALSPDGTRILTGSDWEAQLWELKSGSLLTTLQDQVGMASIAFSPDGARILTGSSVGKVRLWETTSGKVLARLKDHTDKVMSVVFSPDGSKMLTCSLDKTARLWETRSGKTLVSFEDNVGRMTSAIFSPDGHLVMTCNEYGWVLIWEASGPGTGNLLGVYVATYEIGAVHWQDASHMILADKGGPRRPHFYRLKLEGHW